MGRRYDEDEEGDATGSTSRARTRLTEVPADAHAAVSREQRVAIIARMMGADQWPAWPDSVGFRERLAAVWQCAPVTIRGYAAEAHRIVAIDPEEREQLRAEIAKRMKELADDASVSLSRVTGLPDYGSAVKALNDYARFAGIELETKVKLSGSVALDDLDALRNKVAGGDESSGSE